MLSKPIAGRTTITIGNWSGQCCNKDDVPRKLLEIFFYILRTDNDGIVRFGFEGNENIIVFDYPKTHIIHRDEDMNYTLFTEDITPEALARELLLDISSNYDDWAKWGHENEREEIIEDRKRDLEVLCDILVKWA